MSIDAQVDDILFTLDHVADLPILVADGLFPHLDGDLTTALLRQAASFGQAVLAPLNRAGDLTGARLVDGRVVTPPGFAAAYRQWAEAGWNGTALPEQFGGAGLPVTLNAAVAELHTGACMAFGLGPVLTQGAVDALHAHATPDLQDRFLPKLVSGEWTASMALTEPQAGSDLGLMRTRAIPAADGSYRLFGQKIFITCGDHDLTDNIVHLVLARLPDAPAGTRGISLFVVPKRIPAADGTPAAANDVVCVGLEHKLGLHASPTCVMSFGDAGDGAQGWLVGAPHRGLAAMFTMMNRARLATAIQGVAVAAAATAKAWAYAGERRQGRAPGASGTGPGPIIDHPDVRRMLMTMRAQTAAARAIALVAAAAIDRAETGADDTARARADLLTPIAKAFCTDTGIEVASLGIQVHGGMGFVEETGAAQYWRDVRITSIYEGTNAIQAIDLVGRKLPMAGGAPWRALVAEWRDLAARAADTPAGLGATNARLTEALDHLDHAAAWIGAAGRDQARVLAAATPFLRLASLCAGAAWLTKGALAAPGHATAARNARFFAEDLLPFAAGHAAQILGGGGALADDPVPFT